MSATAGALRELHRIHQQLSDLHERMERGPQQVRARAANVARLEQLAAKAHDEAKAARVASDQKQLALRSGEEKIRNWKAKLNAAASNREYQALKDQIAADEMANSVLSDEILELLEKIDVLKQAASDADADLAKAEVELEKVQQTAREQQQALTEEIKRVEAQLHTAEAALPSDVRADYNRIIQSKGSDGMAPVDGESCGGCYQRITANMVNELRLSRLVFCKSCGRLLYLPEDRSPGKG